VAVGCGGRDNRRPTSVEVSRPDIILVLVDALRRDHVGLYGYSRPTTPFIDELGRGGVVFDDALSQAPQTLNSTASLFTSRSFPFLLRGVVHDPVPGVAPEQKEQWARTPRLAAANLTLAEVLRHAGYQTLALFNNPHHHPTSGFDQGFDRAVLLDRDPGQAYARVESVAAAFLDWHAARDRGRPAFAYLHLMEPHNPYRPPEEYQELFPPGKGRYIYANGPPDPGFTTDDLATMTALYDAEIRYLDDGLRRLGAELRDRGDLDETVIVITADHGEELMDHGGLGHGKTVELEQLRIPLILAGGAAERWSGVRVADRVRNLDLGPTLADLAGVEIPSEFEGRSLLPLIRGEATAGSPVSFAWNAKLRSLTSDEWHCMRDLGTDRLVLYHRPSDPAGTTDVADANPEIATLCVRELDRLERLKIESERKAAVLKSVETGSSLPPESGDVVDQLRALGYIEE
jgi:arylsulfatase A-like enzyme